MSTYLNNFLSYHQWYDIFNIKKVKLINTYESEILLKNTNEHKYFLSLIKHLLNTNIIDLNRISYLILNFLSPYIDPHLQYILMNDKDILFDDIDLNNLYLPPTDTTIINIIEYFINFIIHLEVSLNLHIFILYSYIHNYFIKYDIIIENKPNFMFKLDSILKNINNSLTKSTSILLLMNMFNNLMNKLFDNTKYNETIISEVRNSKIRLRNYSSINNIQLDKFIISIINYFKNSTAAPQCEQGSNTENSEHNDFNSSIAQNSSTQISSTQISLWSICKEYLLSLVENGIENIVICLDILIKYLIKENPKRENKLNQTKNTIINFLHMEKNILNNKLS
jgi:hypothetical protein